MNKKCPFCGGNAHYVIGSYELVGGPTIAEGYIKCENCKAEGPKVSISNDYHYEEPPTEKIDEMWELWNKRISD